ncbi:hypothetical protein [Streptomyces sp. NBC_00344]|uniref:hypothetical protein n=1 Tax=Streptomyces sp. NBC_00344 TaxID=2975720 RepID=UPI002E1A788F
MAARTHISSHAPAGDGVEIRLPWWAVALPAIAFAALLLLISAPGQAHAAAADPTITHLLERVRQSLPL